MTKKELESFKKRLLADRERLLADLARENQEIQATGMEDGDIVDIASANYDKNLLIGIMTRVEKEQLEKIDSALQRIEKGNFGQCISCGKKIDKDRLKVMPVSLKCFDCKKNEDVQIGGAFAMQAAPPFSSKKTTKKKAASKKSSVKKTSVKKNRSQEDRGQKIRNSQKYRKKKRVQKNCCKKSRSRQIHLKKDNVQKIRSEKKRRQRKVPRKSPLPQKKRLKKQPSKKAPQKKAQRKKDENKNPWTISLLKSSLISE